MMENPPVQDDRRALGAGAITTIGGLALLVVFVLQNTNDVQVSFLFWDFVWPIGNMSRLSNFWR